MSNSRITPAFTKIISTDYFCLVLVIIPALFVLFSVGAFKMDKVDIAVWLAHLQRFEFAALGRAGILLGFTVCALIACPLLLALRIQKIRRVFREGLEAPGTVVFVRVFKDRGRIEFEFEHEGSLCRAGNAVHRTRAVQAIRLHQAVTVYYLQDNPKTAFIREIFV